MFSVHTTPGTLDLCFRKPRVGKSRDYQGATVFEELRLQNVFLRHENKSPWIEDRFQKAPFLDGLLWTVGLTIEIKLRQCLIIPKL